MSKSSGSTGGRAVGSKELKAVLKRVESSDLSGEDKALLAEILDNSIKLKALIENATTSIGEKKVIATLPFGFDIVK